MGGITKIDPREKIPDHWDKGTDERHTFRLFRYEGYLLEMEDLHFHHNSAVLIGDYETEPDQILASRKHITGLAVLRACYRYLEEYPDRKMLIVGHTDTTGSETYNNKLSEKRAQSVVAALEGDRDTWVRTARDQSQVEDYQRILQWVHKCWGWLCDPVKVDNMNGPATKRAVEAFQSLYNREFNASISVDGIVGKQTWTAIFDVYMDELMYILETNEQGLKDYRGQLQFVDASKKFVGCGEHYPKEAIGIDEYRSRENRRVEVLFFEEKDLPKLDQGSAPSPLPPGMSVIYNPKFYALEYLPVEPIPQLVWIDLQTVNEFGQKVPNFDLKLDSKESEAISIKTDDSGYWSGRVRAGRELRVTTSDDKPVKFGASHGDQRPPGDSDETVVLTPSVASRTVTDLVVPVLSQDLIDQRNKVAKRYGRNLSDNQNTARSGEVVQYDGEPAMEKSGRGFEPQEDEKPRFSRRTAGQYVADNLFIAAGWDDKGATDYDELWKVLKGWLADYHPTTVARGYFLEFIFPKGAMIISGDEREVLDIYVFKDELQVQGRIGAYALFEFSESGNKTVFHDMSTGAGGIGIKFTDESKEADQGFEDNRSSLPEDKILLLEDLVKEEYRDKCVELLNRFRAERRVNVAYVVPNGAAPIYARYGGTGVLEDYPSDKSLHESIHKRNKSVVEWAGKAYTAYLNGYIKKVEDIDPDPKSPVNIAMPHPEVQLYRLGPPEAPHTWPMPAGATTQQYRDLLLEHSEAGLRAWMAIAKKLDEIWGRKTEGSIWFVVEFSAEAGNFAGPLSGASVKLNFEADSEGHVGLKPEYEVPLTVKAVPTEQIKTPANAKYSVQTDKKTGRSKTTVGFDIGTYGVEADSEGNVKFSAGTAYTEWNQSYGRGGGGLDVSLRDLVAKGLFKGKEVPSWVGDLPNLKAKVGLHFQGVTQGTVLKLVANSPGFFEMRPRVEFSQLDWVSLDFDEQHHLETLGFTKEHWDFRQLPNACTKQWISLTPKQKVATTKIPIPTADPYWQDFWSMWRRRKVKETF